MPHKTVRDNKHPSFISSLDVVYVHKKTHDGGDLYLTRFGITKSKFLKLENWYDKEWFTAYSEKLAGTSAVYRVPTRKISGESLQLVVKNCRVGEDIPLDTHTAQEFINAEFNSPWEEFSLVMEMREGSFGTECVSIKTQLPLAIYVPPQRLQLWQTGRSVQKIKRIHKRHPGIQLDVLRQYKLIYQWINGLNIIEALEAIGLTAPEIGPLINPWTQKAISDMGNKGYVVADMKACHVIISGDQINEMHALSSHDKQSTKKKQIGFLADLINNGVYSIIDYELLMRTPIHETQIKTSRRTSYLEDQNNRFKPSSSLPDFLTRQETFNTPYVHGIAESTGGLLWVVGCNPHLFDYFLPERWRGTPRHQLSDHQEVFYTLTKDNVHIVWRISRVGERLPSSSRSRRAGLINEVGFNSPFEESAIAHDIACKGVPCVYVRAIYMTGSSKLEPVVDTSRFNSHRQILAMDGLPALREDRNYITIRGFYNGPDHYVATHRDKLHKPLDVERSIDLGVLTEKDGLKLLDMVKADLDNIGYCGDLLEQNDILVTMDHDGKLVNNKNGTPEVRICNFELIYASQKSV